MSKQDTKPDKTWRVNSPQQLFNFETELTAWQWQLRNQPDVARATVDKIIRDIAPRHHYTELAKWKMHLLAGIACPQDFTRDRRPSS